MKLKHYLLTVPLGSVNMHGYLMTRKGPNEASRLGAGMMNHIESKMGPVPLPIILQTTLDEEGVRIVREVLAHLPDGQSDKVMATLAKATDYHQTVFAIQAGIPDDDKLMELH